METSENVLSIFLALFNFKKAHEAAEPSRQ